MRTVKDKPVSLSGDRAHNPSTSTGGTGVVKSPVQSHHPNSNKIEVYFTPKVRRIRWWAGRREKSRDFVRTDQLAFTGSRKQKYNTGEEGSPVPRSKICI